MKMVCPKCKSDDLTEYSRRKYFLRLAISSVAALLCCLEFIILENGDVDIVNAIGIFICAVLFCIAACLAIVYGIKGKAIKEASYKCEFCVNTFQTGLMVEGPEKGERAFLDMIWKQK